jgi:hypothetical protein
MSICPRCQQPVDEQAISCPYCNNPLKAFGHPGIPLYQSQDNTWLCDRCIYDRDDTCNFPQRPYAKSCTLFHDVTEPLIPEKVTPVSQVGWTGIKNRLYRHRGIIAIAILIIFSVMLALNY